MGIKFSVVGEALKRILIDPALDDSGICQNLRIELLQEDLDERDIIKLNILSAAELGITLNKAIFHGWPEHSGSGCFPVGRSVEYVLHPYDKWNDQEDSGKKRRRLLKYSIQVCKENPDKELEL